jgi:hypothetical protein
MQSEVPPLSPSDGDGPDPARGLPAVLPPSGKHIARLFLVPLVIVTAVILVLGAFLWYVLAPRSPDYYLKGLGSSNPDVRWRTAEELARVLPNDANLASDPEFALELADLLDRWLDENKQNEQRRRDEQAAKPPPDSPTVDEKSLKEERDAIQYLIQCLGHFYVPVGAPLLARIAQDKSSADAETVTQRRQGAVWALAKLGEKCQHYEELPTEKRAAIEAKLAEEAEGDGARHRWARAALDYLQRRGPLGVDEALEQCAKDADPLLRQVVALALTFWDGPRVEPTLAQLARDDGHGGNAADVPRQRLQIRYQATAALARHGSPLMDKEEHLKVLGEMLDEEHLLKSFRTQKDGEDVPDLPVIHGTVTQGLRATVALHRKRPELDLSELYRAIDKLTESSAFGSEAKATRKELAQLDSKEN